MAKDRLSSVGGKVTEDMTRNSRLRPTKATGSRVLVSMCYAQTSFFVKLLVFIDDSGSLSTQGLYGAAITCSGALPVSSSV